MAASPPVARREWALFGVRWILPAAVLLYLLHPRAAGGQDLALVLAVGVLAVVSNLVLLLLLLSESWPTWIFPAVIVADGILSLAAVAVTDASLVWVGLLPILLTGLAFNTWIAALVVGLVIGVGMAALQLAWIGSDQFNIGLLILTLLTLPGAGVAANFLRPTPIDPIAKPVGNGATQRAERAIRRANELVSVMYEMVEVLSAAKLNPDRVLTAAVSLAIDGIVRTGIEPPVYGAILLLSQSQDGHVLRVSRASISVPPGDQEVVVADGKGLIGQVMSNAESALCHEPGQDAELSLFKGSFGLCRTVLGVPVKIGDDLYGVMLIGSQKEDSFKDIHINLMSAIARQAAASLHSALLYETLREQRDRIVQVRKDERAQLAGALHDGPTQSISAIAMRANFIRRLIDKKPEKAVEEIYQIEDMARRTTKEIRAMLFELRPLALDQGLEAGLRQLAIKVKDTYDQNLEVRVRDHCDRLLDEHATQVLFSFVVEAVNNARKHAQADLITVELGVRDNAMVLEVSDNGVGFDTEKALSEARNRIGHLGLINLQEQAAFLEGSFLLESEVGKGSRIGISVPMEIVHRRKAEESERKAGQQPESGGFVSLTVRR